MAKNWKQILVDANSGAGKLGQAAPETMKAFGVLMTAATADGALDKKTKELMCIAISICIRCVDCIAYHTNSAIKAGATKEEVAETVAVAVEMGGGPAVMYGKEVLEAFDALS